MEPLAEVEGRVRAEHAGGHAGDKAAPLAQSVGERPLRHTITPGLPLEVPEGEQAACRRMPIRYRHGLGRASSQTRARFGVWPERSVSCVAALPLVLVIQ